MEGLLWVVVVLGVVLVSMILHELAHGLVAYWLGDDTAKAEGRLTLNPLKHLDPVLSVFLPLLMFVSGGPIFGGAKPVPVNSRNLKGGVWGMALVAVAGPLVNFILAFLLFVAQYFWGGLETPEVLRWIMGVGTMVNLGFGVFNLIPIPPLDGSRVLYALAPDAVRGLMEKMERWGIMIVLVLVMLFPGAVATVMNGAIEGILTAFSWLVH